MWQITAISVIVAFVGFLFYGWWKSKSAETASAKDKVDALEAAAEQERKEEHDANAKEAEEVAKSDDPERGIGFLRDSFKTRR